MGEELNANVEDVVKFCEKTMPVFSALVAGAIGYYFGAHQPRTTPPPLGQLEQPSALML